MHRDFGRMSGKGQFINTVEKEDIHTENSCILYAYMKSWVPLCLAGSFIQGVWDMDMKAAGGL